MLLFGAAGFVNAILFFSTGRRFGFADRQMGHGAGADVPVQLEEMPANVAPAQPA
jgi:hypothetical protein